MRTIFLIRHCQAEGQEPEARLTEAGEKQARELAAFLKNSQIDYIVSSPFERAVSTIGPFAVEAGIEVETDERLSERVLSGAPHPDWLNMLKKSFNDPDLAFDGGESGGAAAKRGVEVIIEVQGKPAENVAIVTHGNLMALILKHYDESYGFEQWKALSNPDVYEIHIDGEKTKIKRIWGL
ncbi:histidine phosphatase family protein [Bacillus sp. FJAT-27445]|uniref:histidine phosphatase family protein n=1 Tax=Bacillus sp. FJAT-27445 TaxID=1679166 RepID=UPI00074413CD|nr:histidine phosphatase family protein [Bacillus sp. FJAT-27445]